MLQLKMSYPIISTASLKEGKSSISPAIGSQAPSAATILTCWRPAVFKLLLNTYKTKKYCQNIQLYSFPNFDNHIDFN